MAVIEKYVTGSNPSAVIMSRIRAISAGGPASGLSGGGPPRAAPHSPFTHAPPSLLAFAPKAVVGPSTRVIGQPIRLAAPAWFPPPSAAWAANPPRPPAWAQPSPTDLVSQFVAQNDLDASVEQALRQLPYAGQQQVMDKYVTGRNKSAIVMSRIREASAQTRGPVVLQNFQAHCAPVAVGTFVMENSLDEGCERALRDLPPDQFAVVADKYVSGGNKSAVVMKRIRDMQNGLMPCQVGGQSNVRAPMLGGMMTQQALPSPVSPFAPQNLDPVAEFCLANELDEGAEKALRQQSVEVQSQVIEKYVSGTNKSAVVMKRIRDAGGTTPLKQHAAGSQSLLPMPNFIGQPPPPRSSPSSPFARPTSTVRTAQFFPEPAHAFPKDEVAVWCQQNGLDVGVERAMKLQPAHIQATVMEAYITGGNKSAVVIGRIRNLESQGAVPIGGARVPMNDPVAAFIAEHNLDQQVSAMLREQPPDVCQEVISKYVTGNNKSAVVVRRIRDLRQSYGL